MNNAENRNNPVRIELTRLARAFTRTGRVDLTRWSPEVAAGLGMTLTNLGNSKPEEAKRFAFKAIYWNRMA